MYYHKTTLPPKRSIRRLRIFRHSAYIFLFLAFLLVGITYFIFLDAIQIKSIVFRGLESIEEEEIRKSVRDLLNGRELFLFPKSNIFLASSKEIENNLLKKFPHIGSIDVNKDFFPAGLSLTIKERALWVILCRVELVRGEPNESIEECYYMDKEGIIFGHSPQFSGTLITKIKDFASTAPSLLSSPLRARELDYIRVFKDGENMFEELRGLQFVFDDESRDSFEIKTAEGWRVILDVNADPKELLENLLLSLREEIKGKRLNLDYIDLRLGNKIFYKFKN